MKWYNYVIYGALLVISSAIACIVGGTGMWMLWAFGLSFATVEWQMTTVMALVICITCILTAAACGWMTGHVITSIFVKKGWLR